MASSEQPTDTAEVAAMCLAAHLEFDSTPKIFEDPFAFELLGPCRRVLMKFPGAFRLFQALRPIRSERARILVRARYAEDRLERAIARGVCQYVMLGAGFDTYGLRRRESSPPLRIFELDLAGNQRVKRSKVARLRPREPSGVHYVPIDLESGSVAGELQQAGFSRLQPTFFSWLGVVQCLPLPAILRTLHQLGDCAAAGSELVLDYAIARDSLPADDVPALDQAEFDARRRGQPMCSSFTSDKLARLAAMEGWDLAENMAPEDQRRLYLAGRRDGLDIPGLYSLAAFERASAVRS